MMSAPARPPSPPGWWIFLGPAAVTVVQVVVPAIVQSFITHLRYVRILPKPTAEQPANQKKSIEEQEKYWNICVAVSRFFFLLNLSFCCSLDIRAFSPPPREIRGSGCNGRMFHFSRCRVWDKKKYSKEVDR